MKAEKTPEPIDTNTREKVVEALRYFIAESTRRGHIISSAEVAAQSVYHESYDPKDERQLSAGRAIAYYAPLVIGNEISRDEWSVLSELPHPPYEESRIFPKVIGS